MKKFISILLAVMLVASVVVTASAYTVWPVEKPEGYTGEIAVEAKTADEAIAEYEAENDVTVETHKYLFLMPNGENGFVGADGVTKAPSWYNEYSKGAGVYWWGSGEAGPTAWAGYQAMVEDADQCIWYANVPAKCSVFIFNNGIDGTKDDTYPLFKSAAQTVDISCEYPDPGEYASIPEGADSFDNMIFVVDPDQVSIAEFSGMPTCGGTWYFYYGNGCFGSYATTSANFKSIDENCCNPDHFKDGVHVGYQPPVQYVRGDYDKDTEITIMDATRAQNILADLYTEEDEAYLAGVDADGDGELTIMDATRVQNFLAELMNMDGTPIEAEV